MSRKNYFEEVAKLFGDYQKTKKRLNAEYEELEKSGMYSKKYLQGIQQENLQKLRKESSTVTSRFSKIKEDYTNELAKDYDLSACRFDAGLQSVLSSGVRLTEKEILNLAKKYEGDYGNSRLLHDYAEGNGYTLRNIIPLEDAERDFDNYMRQVSASMGENSFLPPYTDYDFAKAGAESYYSQSTVPKMDIFKTPETVDEEIAQAIKDEKAAVVDDNAFLAGFAEETVEETASNAENNPIDNLTAEEKADAEHMSVYFGHGGEITEKEIEYLKSDEYKKAIKEREESN